MFGLKEAGLLGATAVLAGGVAYLVWVYASSSREKGAKTQPGEGAERARKEGARKEGKRDNEPVEAVAAAPVAAAAAPKTSEVRRRPKCTHRPGDAGTIFKVVLNLCGLFFKNEIHVIFLIFTQWVHFPMLKESF